MTFEANNSQSAVSADESSASVSLPNTVKHNPILVAALAYQSTLQQSDEAQVSVQAAIRGFVVGKKLNTQGVAFAVEAITKIEARHWALDGAARANILRSLLKQPLERATGDQFTLKKDGGVWTVAPKAKRDPASATDLAMAERARFLAYVKAHRADVTLLAAIAAAVKGDLI